MTPWRRGLVVIAALGALPGCEADPAGADPCGNGVIDPGERCDGSDLHGWTCGDVIPGSSGTLLCSSDCRFFSGLCAPGVCGDGVRQPGEDCDDGNTTAGDGCSATCGVEVPSVCGDFYIDLGEECDDGNLQSGDGCSSSCQLEGIGPCGDGIIDWGESCDGTALDGLGCELLGYTGGQLACSGDCRFDDSRCLDCAYLEVICDGGCTDVMVDPFHCGWCDNLCVGTPCVGGSCLAAGAAWRLVEAQPGDASEVALAHDLLGIDGALYVAWVATDVSGRRVKTKVLEMGSTGWEALTPWPSASATEVADAVSLADGIGLPFRLWSQGDGAAAENVHVDQGGGGPVFTEWDPPGWTSACGAVTFLDLSLPRGSTSWEALVMGQPLCGGAVQHAYRDEPLGWRTHPTATGVPGQVIAHAAGRPAVAATDRGYVAVAELDPEGRTRHSVRYWDGAWIPLGSDLDVNDATGLQEDLALTASAAGTLWVAWSESDGSDPPVHDVYVKRYAPGIADWVLVGSGPVNPAPGAVTPALLLLGPTAWIAFVDVSGAVATVRVRRYDPLSDAWVDAGGALNVDPLVPAGAPVLAGVLGMPHVAFREGGALRVSYLY